MTFENQNKRAKVRLELSEGVLVEVPLVLIVRAIQEQHMMSENTPIAIHRRWTGERRTRHWAFPDSQSDKDSLVHFIVTTDKDTRDRVIGNLGPDSGNE